MATAVIVRFFASLREAVGEDRLDLHVDEPCVSGVRARLATVLPADSLQALAAPGVRVCVNQTIVRHDARLEAGDEVAFVPPVTGG